MFSSVQLKKFKFALVALCVLFAFTLVSCSEPAADNGASTTTTTTNTTTPTTPTEEEKVAPAGFVTIPAVSIDGSETWVPTSSLFVKNRKLDIACFYMCDHEVTRNEFNAVMGALPSNMKAYSGEAGNNPVTYVSWYDAITYCNKLSIKEGLTPCYTATNITDWTSVKYSEIPHGTSSETWDVTCDFSANGYRLPTEAEWEWAARGGGDGTTYAGSNTIGEVAWYEGNFNSTTHEVKTKKANGYGLYDMSGNVEEWCYDGYLETITASTGSVVEIGTTYGILRGGSYADDDECAVNYRGGNAKFKPSESRQSAGFRVVCGR